MDGKLVLITGATGGLGYETALALAEKGATVILAGRNANKGQEAMDKIWAICPQAKISFGLVDLGSLASIREFAAKFLAENEKLDVLVNNAGIMTPPERKTTSDGFEVQMGTNHLAHFALTALLLPALKRADSPRVVTVSSNLAHTGKIHFDDLQWEKQKYNGLLSYSQSKLANLLFSFELQRLSDLKGWGIMSVAAHPGVARTDLIANGPGDVNFLQKLVMPIMSHDAAAGALPTLLAATSPQAEKAGFYGPQGCLEMKGAPGPAKIPCKVKDEESAKKLWEVSCELTGVSWE